MIRVRAPAKINLYLRVLGKRPDGYHEIETLVERIDLADELTCEPAEKLTLSCTDPSLSCGEDNLVLKAARALQQATDTRRGARLHLTKRIPIAAGLGGGSSDAAAALRGLNKLWDLELSDARLAALAAQIGSDVPFFLQPEPFAIGQGRGERCEELPVRTTFWHVLITPEAQLSAKDIYAAGGFDLTAPKPSITIVRHALRNGSPSELAQGIWNDLEPEAIRRCPVITHLQSHLRTLGCLNASVSGSGPSIFGLCRDAIHAHDVATRLQGLTAPVGRIAVIQTDQVHEAIRTR